VGPLSRSHRIRRFAFDIGLALVAIKLYMLIDTSVAIAACESHASVLLVRCGPPPEGWQFLATLSAGLVLVALARRVHLSRPRSLS
jgi:hypothetical protein